MSRKLDDLVPEMQRLAILFRERMEAEGFDFIFTCTYRSQEEQDALYAQGRTKPGKKVTWTQHSKHTRRIAFDIVIMKDGKPIWDILTDTNNDGYPDYVQAGEIGEDIGLVWGGRWKKPDRPHFEMKEV